MHTKFYRAKPIVHPDQATQRIILVRTLRRSFGCLASSAPKVFWIGLLASALTVGGMMATRPCHAEEDTNTVEQKAANDARTPARENTAEPAKTEAMTRSIQMREKAFAGLPRLERRMDQLDETIRHALTTDKFDFPVYFSAIEKLRKHLVPASEASDAKKLREAMRQFSSAELAALDDFVLSTSEGKSMVGSQGKTCAEVLLQAWQAVLDGPSSDYHPIFIESAMRNIVISLPSGCIFEAGSFFPQSGIRELFENAKRKKDDYSILMPTRANGTAFAVLHQQSGKLNGPAFAQFEDGGLMMAGNYSKNDRVGRFLVLSEDRSIRFAGEFDKGDKHGVACFFLDGKPLMAQECRRNRVDAWHLIREDGTIEASYAELPAKQNADLQNALQYAKQVEDELREGEKKVKTYVEKVENSVRLWRAAQNSQRAQARFGDLQRLRAAADGQLMGNLQNWTGGGK